jgi:hypothetical protein
LTLLFRRNFNIWLGFLCLGRFSNYRSLSLLLGRRLIFHLESSEFLEILKWAFYCYNLFLITLEITVTKLQIFLNLFLLLLRTFLFLRLVNLKKFIGKSQLRICLFFRTCIRMLVRCESYWIIFAYFDEVKVREDLFDLVDEFLLFDNEAFWSWLRPFDYVGKDHQHLIYQGSDLSFVVFFFFLYFGYDHLGMRVDDLSKILEYIQNLVFYESRLMFLYLIYILSFFWLGFFLLLLFLGRFISFQGEFLDIEFKACLDFIDLGLFIFSIERVVILIIKLLLFLRSVFLRA